MGPQEFPITVAWGQTIRLTITAGTAAAISEVFVDCRDEPLPDPGPADARCCVVDLPETSSVRTGLSLAECRALTTGDGEVEARWAAGRVCETVCCRLTSPTHGADEVRHERMPRGSCTDAPLVGATVVDDASCR